MANQCNVVVLEEVTASRPDDWTLCLQWCRYIYEDRSVEYGYRFIWRWPHTRKLQAARGQARIPSVELMQRLISEATAAGWGNKRSEDADYFLPAETGS